MQIRWKFTILILSNCGWNSGKLWQTVRNYESISVVRLSNIFKSGRDKSKGVKENRIAINLEGRIRFFLDEWGAEMAVVNLITHLNSPNWIFSKCSEKGGREIDWNWIFSDLMRCPEQKFGQSALVYERRGAQLACLILYGEGFVSCGCTLIAFRQSKIKRDRRSTTDGRKSPGDFGLPRNARLPVCELLWFMPTIDFRSGAAGHLSQLFAARTLLQFEYAFLWIQTTSKSCQIVLLNAK